MHILHDHKDDTINLLKKKISALEGKIDALEEKDKALRDKADTLNNKASALITLNKSKDDMIKALKNQVALDTKLISKLKEDTVKTSSKLFPNIPNSLTKDELCKTLASINEKYINACTEIKALKNLPIKSEEEQTSFKKLINIKNNIIDKKDDTINKLTRELAKITNDKEIIHQMYNEAMRENIENNKNMNDGYNGNDGKIRLNCSKIEIHPSNVMPKEIFVETMEFCSDRMDYIDKAENYIGYDGVLEKFSETVEFIIDDVDRNLSQEFYTDIDWIPYFTYELNFLKDYKEGCVSVKDEKTGENVPIDVSSWDKVYDFVLEEVAAMRKKSRECED